MKIDLQTAAVFAAGLAVVAVGVLIAKKGVAGAAAAAVGAVGDAAAGTVVGIGQVIGIPATNETECERARREGRTWDASFACPAGTFLSYLVGADTPTTPQASYDELDRLLKRYPAPEPERTTYYDPMGVPIGAW